MTVLPHDIKVMFYKIFEDDISIDDFEEWLYNNNELENHLNPDDYFDLISMNFKKKGSKDELRDLLKKHFAPGEFETLKMLRLLNEAKLKTERLPFILMEFYELYCQGYSFLEDLGLGIGFTVEVPRLTNTTFDTWDELTREQQKELLDSFSPFLEDCIEQVIIWLETSKIILTGEKDENEHYDYEDYRTAEESKSKIWVTVLEDKGKGFYTRKNLLWAEQPDCEKQARKKWWEFWK